MLLRRRFSAGHVVALAADALHVGAQFHDFIVCRRPLITINPPDFIAFIGVNLVAVNLWVVGHTLGQPVFLSNWHDFFAGLVAPPRRVVENPLHHVFAEAGEGAHCGKFDAEFEDFISERVWCCSFFAHLSSCRRTRACNSALAACAMRIAFANDSSF